MPSSAQPARQYLTRDDVLDGREVAALLNLPHSTVREYARRGVLPAHRLGRRWVFIRDEVAAALRAAPQTVPPRQPALVKGRASRADRAAQLALPFDSVV
jgi:excisionase family DNA binding protein